uniref:Uncharacterized protein n=1 Tax=Tanacetum cinerariifolium TaxID=118510 RepID=A0A6L2NLW7_TANCI|nr:hypothetical protein [Tanacetum cinerariifolium]
MRVGHRQRSQFVNLTQTDGLHYHPAAVPVQLRLTVENKQVTVNELEVDILEVHPMHKLTERVSHATDSYGIVMAEYVGWTEENCSARKIVWEIRISKSDFGLEHSLGLLCFEWCRRIPLEGITMGSEHYCLHEGKEPHYRNYMMQTTESDSNEGCTRVFATFD